METIQIKKFKDINFNNHFFDTLAQDYPEFREWIVRKSEKSAFYLENEGEIDGFLYLKLEEEANLKINPEFSLKKRLKIGTFKVNAHGTSIGEAFIKIILSRAILKKENYDEIYVTIFEKHEGLVRLLKKYGFKYWGYKITNKKKESVYIRDLTYIKSNRNEHYLNYPLIKKFENQKFILSVISRFHTRLFPESKLFTEKNLTLSDIAYTNGVQKIYMCNMKGVKNLQVGDKGIIYRPGESERKKFTSVATSIVTVVETKHINDFGCYKDYTDYCNKYSVFSEKDLNYFWSEKKYPYIIKMLYNFPLKKRIILKDLRDKVGLDDEYWGFKTINNKQFEKILELGEVNENFIVD